LRKRLTGIFLRTVPIPSLAVVSDEPSPDAINDDAIVSDADADADDEQRTCSRILYLFIFKRFYYNLGFLFPFLCFLAQQPLYN